MNPPDWPKVGELYVWEMLLPHAVAGIIVIDLKWNGEEWWVQDDKINCQNEPMGKLCWNTLDRFQEACLPYKLAKESSP